MSVRSRVLVCDADPQSLRALRVVLRGAGFAVDQTSTANAALDHSALRAPDGAIIELVLPDGDGVQVCRRLREQSHARTRSCGEPIAATTSRSWHCTASCESWDAPAAPIRKPTVVPEHLGGFTVDDNSREGER